MLNRRILRIKAMQALYGFYTTRESLKQVVRDHLELKFTPNALHHDLSDTEELDQNRKIAMRLFDENFKAGKIETDQKVSDEVFNAVNDAIQGYYREIGSESSRVKKTMVAETKDLQNQYYKFLILPSEFQFYEKQDKEKKEMARIQKNDPWRYNLQSNPLIDAITTNPELQKAITAHKIGWEGETEEVRSWYRNVLKKDEKFIEYQNLAQPTAEDHFSIMKYIFKSLLFKNATLVDYFEEENIRWAEDGQIIRSMLVKTIQDYDPTAVEPIQLKTISINEEDDFEFFETIYQTTLKEDEFLERQIADKAKNWDVTRLAQTDRIILKMALAEMMSCRSIPTKVTINEFIEICKLYSTPKSKQFVNGILDVLANQLTSEGVIKKSGRGLIDNR